MAILALVLIHTNRVTDKITMTMEQAANETADILITDSDYELMNALRREPAIEKELGNTTVLSSNSSEMLLKDKLPEEAVIGEILIRNDIIILDYFVGNIRYIYEGHGAKDITKIITIKELNDNGKIIFTNQNNTKITKSIIK